MNKEIFKSNRCFAISDFLNSHGQLLLRSVKDDINYRSNIDIIFFGVDYMQLSKSFDGLTIKMKDTDQSLIGYNSVNRILSHKENYLFEIKSNEEKFYIVCVFFKIYENELEFHQTSLGLSEYFGRDKLIVTSK